MDEDQIQSTESKDWYLITLLLRTKADKTIPMLIEIIETQKNKCR
jgi:hypothetical protein